VSAFGWKSAFAIAMASASNWETGSEFDWVTESVSD
jgi:hypothetical protein